MATDTLEQLKYPIGKFVRGTKAVTPKRIVECIEVISAFPQVLRKEVDQLADAQLDTRYRPEGWTIRQLVHHIADSHGQSLQRFKLALTEEKPVIKPYKDCLLYTSDAADERSSVDLGGRRIIKKKTHKQHNASQHNIHSTQQKILKTARIWSRV